MSEAAAAFDDTTLKAGLLMETVQSLRAHTQDLDEVVRDEIRRTLVEELQQLTAEAARATRALNKIRAGAGIGALIRSVAAALLCTLIPLGIAYWVMPSPQDLERLRVRRDELSANLQKLEQQGGRIDWRRCGETRRLCVRIDRGAPSYGDKADYFVIQGY